MEVAAAGIFQVTQVELQHLFFQLAEVDAGLPHKSFVDLLYLFCSGNGASRRKQL